MEQEKKKCHSIMSSEFEKALKKAGHDIAKKILKEIEKLEFDENNPDKLPDGVKSAELAHGKMLTEVNRTIYSLEPSFKIRALAHVTQRNGVKVYVWLWGGTHEEYNHKIKAHALHNDENSSKKKYGEEIKEQINEMSTNLSKDKVSANISSIRESIKGKTKNGKHNKF